MGEGSDCEVEDYDAVQSGMLLVLLTFWFFWRNRGPPFFRTKVNYVGKWEVIQEKLYQNARQHSLQDYKNRHTNLFR